MHTRLIEGRDFESRDFEPAAVPVAVVNQTLARRHFLNESPIGKTFSMEGEPPRWIQVIGIVQDTKYDNLRKPAPPLIYLPYTLGSSDPRMSLAVAGRVDVRSIAAVLRREARAANPNFAVEKITTLNKLVDDTLLRESLLAKLASFFGMVALLLSAIGIYGIMSYAVTQRTQEIGIRMALGAERRDVLRMVLRESITVLAAGVTVGTAVALATMRVVASLLFGLAPHDPSAMLIGVGILVAVALAAAFIPAHRASQIHPIAALRHE
jgi:predicted permease